MTRRCSALTIAVVILALMAGVMPWIAPRRVDAASSALAFPGWPATWEGLPLEAESLDAREAAEAAAFPGRIGRFRCGDRTLVIHWIARRTRLFHFSDLCLRGGGWSLEPRADEVDASGRSFAVHLARQDDVTMKLMTRIESGNDPSCDYTDPSDWFWSVLDESDPGPPYWAFTIAEVWTDPAAR